MKLSRLFVSILFVLSLILGAGFAMADEFDGLEELTIDDYDTELVLEEDEFNLDIDAEEDSLELDFGDEFGLDVEDDEDVELDFGDDFNLDVDGEGDVELDFGDDFNLDIDAEDDFGLFEDQQINVNVGSTTEASIELSFDKVDGYTDYKVLYSKVPLFEAPIEEVLETTTSIEDGMTEGTVTVEGLEALTTYYFVVVALDDTGLRDDETQSEEVGVFTETTFAAASEENFIMEVDHEVNNLTADVTFTAGKDVVTVMVYVSDDATNFTAKEAEVDATTGVYTFSVEDYTTKYVRLVPVNGEGVAGEIPDVEVIVFEAPMVSMGTPETGPALNIAILMAMLVAGAYVYRRRRA